MSDDVCADCGRPRWLGGEAYYYSPRFGVMFVPPVPGETCECAKKETDEIAERLEAVRRDLARLQSHLPPSSP